MPPAGAGPGTERGHGRRTGGGRPVAVDRAGAVVLVVLVGVAAYFVTGPRGYPEAWDPQVAPIAAQVATLRGLSFDHPVPVKYLDDAEFKKRVGVDSSKLTPRRSTGSRTSVGARCARVRV